MAPQDAARGQAEPVTCAVSADGLFSVDAAAREVTAEPAQERLPEVEPSGTEDIVESLEEGIDYVPPVGPIPGED